MDKWIYFIGGSIVGGSVVYFAMVKRFEKKAAEEINEMKEYYEKTYAEIKKPSADAEEVQKEEDMSDQEEFDKFVKKYTNYNSIYNGGIVDIQDVEEGEEVVIPEEMLAEEYKNGEAAAREARKSENPRICKMEEWAQVTGYDHIDCVFNVDSKRLINEETNEEYESDDALGEDVMSELSILRDGTEAFVVDDENSIYYRIVIESENFGNEYDE